MNVHPSSDRRRWVADAVWIFRKKEYVINAVVKDGVLTVEVEEQLTADKWKAQFEAKHIEELTRKTGNFKKFSVFLNMFASALSKSSGSVGLDLLTYTDLEDMWDQKLGPMNRRGGNGSSPVGSKAQAKRYLILTYSVEFDRIHYPLALTYCGQPETRVLQDIIRKLHTELDSTRKEILREYKNSSLSQLQKENALLLQEKEELTEKLLALRHDLIEDKENNSSKEIRILKKVVRHLEEEVLKQHTKYQKTISKRNEEMQLLLQELEELRVSDGVLQARVKNLRKELSLCKREGARIVSKSVYQRRRTSSAEKGLFRERKLSAAGNRLCGLQGVRTPSPFAVARSRRFNPTAYVEAKRKERLEAQSSQGKPKVVIHSRSRSNSVDRLLHPSLRQAIYTSAEKSSNRLSRCNGRVFVRKPSPNYSRVRSHSNDYSAELRTRRQASRDSSAELRKKRQTSRDSSVEPHFRRQVSRNSSAEPRTRRQTSRDSSTESRTRRQVSCDSSAEPCAQRQISRDSSAESGTRRQANVEQEGTRSLYAHLYGSDKEECTINLKRSQEISEIDARLNALQDFMKRSLESASTFK